jgi:hypothetical protein
MRVRAAGAPYGLSLSHPNSWIAELSELIELVRSLGRGWIIVILAAFGAGVVTLVTELPLAVVYHTESIVGVDPAAGNSNDRIDFARNLQAASRATSVLKAVANEVGVSPKTIREGLVIETIGDSNLTRVIFEHSQRDPATAEAIVTLVPGEALRFLRSATMGAAMQRVDELRTALGDAAAEVEAAQAAVEVAITDNANLQPELEFEVIQDQLADLWFRRLSLDPNEDPIVAAQIDDAILQLESSVSEAAARAAEFRVLEDAVEEAHAELASLEGQLRNAEVDLFEASITPEVVVQQSEVPIKRLDVMLRNILSAVVVAGAVALFGTVLGRAFVRRLRQRPFNRISGVTVVSRSTDVDFESLESR